MASNIRITAAGEIDVATAPGLRRELYEAIDANPGAVVVVDLAAVEFLDSTGLGVLVGALKHARTTSGDLQLTQPRPHVWKVFTVTGLNKVFEIAADAG